MRTIAIDVTVARASVRLSVTRLRCANTVEQIEVLYRVETLGGPNTYDGPNGVPISHRFDAAIAKLLNLLFLVNSALTAIVSVYRQIATL